MNKLSYSKIPVLIPRRWIRFSDCPKCDGVNGLWWEATGRLKGLTLGEVDDCSIWCSTKVVVIGIKESYERPKG